MAEERYSRVKVLMEREYLVPMSSAEGEITRINGWTLDEVIKSWFQDHSLNSSHATRDAYRLGGSERVIRVTKLP